MIVLNEKQMEAKEALIEFIYSDEKAIVLTGSAGTGKTATILETMKEFKKLVWPY